MSSSLDVSNDPVARPCRRHVGQRPDSADFPSAWRRFPAAGTVAPCVYNREGRAGPATRRAWRFGNKNGRSAVRPLSKNDFYLLQFCIHSGNYGQIENTQEGVMELFGSSIAGDDNLNDI
jgi:hypothetical protein